MFLRLAEWADVVITNFAPGTMDGVGLGYDDVAARNPRVVYAAGSTYGTEGTDADARRRRPQRAGGRRAHQHDRARRRRGDARRGHDRRSHRGAEPRRRASSPRCSPRSGPGAASASTTSLLGGQIWAQASEYTGCLLRGGPAGRSNRGHPLIPGLYAIFPTADGWIAVVGVVGPLRTTFFDVVGRPEFTERFAQPLYWEAEKAELFPLLDEAFSDRDDRGVVRPPARRRAPPRAGARPRQVVADPNVLGQRLPRQRRRCRRRRRARGVQRHAGASPATAPSSVSTPRRCCSSSATRGTTSRRLQEAGAI